MAPRRWPWICIVFIIVQWSFTVDSQIPYNTTLRIDCGGSKTFVNEYNETWLSDRFYTGGSRALISTSVSREQERTLRYFPTTNGKKNCYVVNLPNGRYSIRLFFIYGNYDRKNRTSNFDVSVEGTVVFSWRYPWTDEEANMGVYSDLYAFINDGDAKICFYSIATDAPVVAALEIVAVDPLSYIASTTGNEVILVNYGRFTGGLNAFGAGVTREGDIGGRAWEPDAAVSTTFGNVHYLTTTEAIKNSSIPPNYFPKEVYQAAHTLTSSGSIEFLFTVDSSLDYLLVFHFAEIDPTVVVAGQRVFDILINNEVAFSGVDILRQVGKYSAYDVTHIIKNLTGSALNVTLTSRAGTPIINGLENYALVNMDLSTDVSEVIAMNALKESLQIPERMGWNGDPCAPYNWDTWEGVTCNFAADGKSLVITRLDLSNQGLKGTISDKISLLGHLLSLNMSNNNLRAHIPSGLGHHKLTTLDLSFNQLTGSIPDSLGQPQLVKVILNNNQLEGQVPVSLYSIGVRGGFINISSNKDLCGVPSLQECPYFWGHKGLSTGAKVGIAFGVLVFVAVISSLLFIYIRRRRRDDYNFGLPHELASRSLRYQRHRNKPRVEFPGPVSKFGFAADMNPL